MTNEHTYSVQEAFEQLQEHNIVNNIEVLRRWLRQGKLEGIAPTSRKQGWRITQTALDSFVAAHSINATNIVELKKELHQLRNTTNTVANNNTTNEVATELEALKTHYEHEIAILKADHIKVLTELKKKHTAEMEAVQADVQESIQHQVDLALENECERMQQQINALQTELYNEREKNIEMMRELNRFADMRKQLLDELKFEREQREEVQQQNEGEKEHARTMMWWELIRKNIWQDYVPIKKQHIKDAAEHRKYSTALVNEVWERIVADSKSRGYKQPRIPYLLEAFYFEGNRLLFDENFSEQHEQVVYAIFEHIRANKK